MSYNNNDFVKLNIDQFWRRRRRLVASYTHPGRTLRSWIMIMQGIAECQCINSDGLEAVIEQDY